MSYYKYKDSSFRRFINIDCFENFPEIETRRLRLRKLRRIDAEAIHGFYSDSEVTRYLDWVSHSVENSRFFIKWFKEGYQKKNALRWGITLKNDDTVIGTIGYHDFYLHSRAELSYDLNRSFWNQGITTEALDAVIPFGFQSLNLHRIQAWTFPENSTSIHLLKKFRFQEEGLMRQYVHLWHKKAWADVRMFARLRND